jgi:hypothetical protein
LNRFSSLKELPKKQGVWGSAEGHARELCTESKLEGAVEFKKPFFFAAEREAGCTPSRLLQRAKGSPWDFGRERLPEMCAPS